MPPLVDNETKEMLIKKTWCHGQAIMPVYGIVCLWWYLHYDGSSSSTTTGNRTNDKENTPPLTLLLAALFLPFWCYLSYRSIFIDFSYKIILIGAIFVEVAHAFVFCVAIKQLNDTFHLIMFVASGLFFIETAAFLTVVTAFRPPSSGIIGSNSGGGGAMEHAHYRDVSDV